MREKTTEETIQAWIQLHRTHRLLLEAVENALKNKGLPPPGWYDVLLELYREKNTGLRQYEINEKVLWKKHNLSRLLDRLEKNQLVERHTCVDDRRSNRIKITAEGEKMLKQVWPVYEQSIQENFGAKLKPEEFIELSRILSNVFNLHKST